MSDDFLSDEFFLKLIRLGVEDAELRHAARIILQKLHKRREEGAENPSKREDAS